MATVNDLLYQLAGSPTDEAEIAEELRVDLATARQCLTRLCALGVVTGPEDQAGRSMWAPAGDAEFPELVAKAKAAGVNVRDPIATFAALP